MGIVSRSFEGVPADTRREYILPDGLNVFFPSIWSKAPIITELREPHAPTAREIKRMGGAVEGPLENLSGRTQKLIKVLLACAGSKAMFRS